MEVIESTRPAWGGGEAWTISQQALLIIGVEEGDSMLLFDRVAGAVVLPRREAAIANGGDNTVRFFDSTGRFLRAVGGTGDGPGQLRHLAALKRHGEELLAGASGRVNVYDQNGELQRVIATPEAILTGVFASGGLVLRRSGVWPKDRQTSWRESATYFVHDDPEPADSVATLPEMAWGTTSTSQPALVMFGGMGHQTVADSGLYHGWNEQFDIGVYSANGSLIRRIRRASRAESVTPKLVAAFIDELMQAQGGSLSESEAGRLREMLATLPRAASVPTHAAMAVDAGGNLWVQRFSVAGYARTLAVQRVMPPPVELEWDVFDKRGIWLGAVVIPPGLMPLEIGDNYLIGVHYNEMDVETIRIYSLTRGAASTGL